MAAPSYAELFAAGSFGQRPLVSAGKLRELAQQRGFDLPLFPRRDVLEPLDGLGGFRPIGFRLTNYTAESTWLYPDPHGMSWREEHSYQPWEAHGWRTTEDRHIVISEAYSPWQLLYLGDVLHMFNDSVQVKWLPRGEKELARFLEERSAAVRARLATFDEQWAPFIKLLVALQPRLWPFRKQRVTLLHDPERDGHIDQVEELAPTFDANALLRRFEMTLDDLARLHQHFASEARRLDPIGRWYRLSEIAPRRTTDHFRGDGLRARDFYDAAWLLRALYNVATGRWLPLADELEDRQFDLRRRHLPRHKNRGELRRSDLKGLLLREGLYPHRIHFFVEGQTEEIVLKAVLRTMGFGETGSGMAVTNMRGVDQAQRHEVLFRSATEVAARTVLLGDQEGTLSKVLERLRADGLFADPGDVLLWERDGNPADFEEANFTDAELLRAIRSVARKRDPTVALPLSVREVGAERAARTRPRRPPPALTKLMLQLAEHRGIRVSKTELAAVLAQKLVRELRRAGDLHSAGERRPLFKQLWLWLASQR